MYNSIHTRICSDDGFHFQHQHTHATIGFTQSVLYKPCNINAEIYTCQPTDMQVLYTLKVLYDDSYAYLNVSQQKYTCNKSCSTYRAAFAFYQSPRLSLINLLSKQVKEDIVVYVSVEVGEVMLQKETRHTANVHVT